MYNSEDEINDFNEKLEYATSNIVDMIYAIGELQQEVAKSKKSTKDLYEGKKPLISFPIDFPQEAFVKICKEVANQFKQIIKVQVDGARVTCMVKPRVGRKWSFFLELCADNESIWDKQYKQSDIPEKYISLVFDRINEFRKEYTKNWSESICPNCKGKMIKKSQFEKWVCVSCEYELPADSFDEDSDIDFWYCDNCGSYLNIQKDFSDNKHYFRCEKCGYNNTIVEDTTMSHLSKDAVLNYCPHCGTRVALANANYCFHCGNKLLLD